MMRWKKMYFIPEISTMINRNKITRQGFLLIIIMIFCSTALVGIHRSHISRQCFSYLITSYCVQSKLVFSFLFIHQTIHVHITNFFIHTQLDIHNKAIASNCQAIFIFVDTCQLFPVCKPNQADVLNVIKSIFVLKHTYI